MSHKLRLGAIIIVKKKRRIASRGDVIKIKNKIIIRNGAKTISLPKFVWET